ncbi:MAG: NADPH-dependent F420 reductase [Anaerolineae bacterium]
MTQTIAVIGGTGREGPGLALRWAKSGRYQVLIGSRQQEKAERVAAELNARLERNLIRGLVNPDAAAAADMVVLTVPYSAHVPTLESVRAGLRGKILVDVTVPLQPPQVSRVHIPPGGSAAAEAQALLGSDVRVVAAFQNVGAAHLQDPDHTIESDVLVCGDDKEAKAEVIALAEAAGMRGLDAGPLQNAVVAEGLTAVLIGINIRYKAKRAGVKITGIDQGVGSNL